MSKDKSESSILTEVIQSLYNAYKDDAFVVRLNSGGFKVGNRFIRTVSISGMPDILFIYRGGLFLGVEVKTSKGKLSDSQIKFEEKCKARQIPYIVVRSAEEALEKVKEYLNGKSVYGKSV